MKKLIGLGVALALLVTFVVPVAVAAQDEITDPGTYSKTPFGILGSGIQLLGELLADLQPIISEVAELPIDLADLQPILNKVGGWIGVNLAWMTDMTAWSMVLAGDVVKTVLSVEFISKALGEETDLSGIEDIFYVVGARLWDP